jgi:Tfp pilus assembly protein PilN
MNSILHLLRPRVTPSVSLWLISVALLIGAAGLVHLTLLETGKVEQTESAISLRERSQKRVVVPRKSAEELTRQRHWSEFHAQRDFPWASVFEAVERSDRSSIELLEFRPEKGSRSIILRGEAQDREALAAYVESLSSQPAFKLLHLSHLQTVKREKISSVSFEIKAGIR